MNYNISKNDFKSFLDAVQRLHLEYSKLNKDNQFNIFSLLRDKYDEVNVHSRFIYELLNPKGIHNQGDKFLILFLSQLEIKILDSEKFIVLRERKNIDILIKGQQQAILIENKIRAGDQNEQLDRYYKSIKEGGFQDIQILYLTLQGDEPTENSRGSLSIDSVNCISYSQDIIQWLDKCIEIAAVKPILRETLVQYSNLIKELTNQSIMKDELLDLLDLLSVGETSLASKLIGNNWNHIRWHTEHRFWKSLEEAIIRNNFTIVPDGKFSDDRISSAIHKRGINKLWFGLMFEIHKKDDLSFRVYFERNGGVLGDYGSVYFGLVAYDSTGRLKNSSPKLTGLANKLKEFSKEDKGEWWLASHFLEPRINFNEFYNEDTAMLLNKEFRHKAIEQYVQTVSEFANNCLQKLEQA